MGLLGATCDVLEEHFVLEDEKRERYAEDIERMLEPPSARPAALTSMAFKMLVVCEMRPSARQWLHAVFRALRKGRATPNCLGQ